MALYAGLSTKINALHLLVGCCLGWLNFRKPGGLDWLAEYPSLGKHHEKLMARAAFADTVPAVPR